MLSDGRCRSPDLPAGSGSSAPGEGRFRYRFRATHDTVRAVLRAVRCDLAGALAPGDLPALELSLAEVLNNVVEHAYGDDRAGPVTLEIDTPAGAVCCRVSDRGRMMPGGRLPQTRCPDLEVPLADLPEGGYGSHLLAELTEDLAYRRLDGVNVMTFTLRRGRG